MQPKPITMKQSIAAIVSLIIIYFICFQYLDRPIAEWAHEYLPGSPIFEISMVCAKIFQPVYWLIIAIMCGILGIIGARQGRNAKPLMFFAGSVILSLVICDIFKTTLARYRPMELFNQGLYGFHYFSHHKAFNSSPSGHTTATFAALFAISRIVDKCWLTILLMFIACLVALSRLVVTAHYLGDVIFAAYVGILSVYWLDSLRARLCPGYCTPKV